VPRFIEVLFNQPRSENGNYVIAAENFSDISDKKYSSVKQEKIVDVRTKKVAAGAPSGDSFTVSILID
jgi:hypothetical protein